MNDGHKIRTPRAILFDHDGVLVNSEPIHIQAWTELLSELGLPQGASIIQSQIGRTAPEMIAAVLDQYKPGWDASEFDVKELSLRKNDFYVAKIKSRLAPFPGVRDGLEWLKRKGIKRAVVSNARTRELHLGLKAAGILDLFDAVISREDAGKAKPDPTPYLLAAARVDVHPQFCMAVEDSPPGLEAALVAKIPAAGVLTTFAREALEQPVAGRPDLRPVWIGNSPGDFFIWLESLGPSREHLE